MDKIYMLTNDGCRDSVNLTNFCVDEKTITKMLKQEIAELGDELIEDSVKIDFVKEIIEYQYIDCCGDVEDGLYCFYTLNII